MVIILSGDNMGYIFSIIAGAVMSIQGVMNTRLSEKIGLYESNAYVQGTAFLVSLITLIFLKNGNFSAIGSVNKLYLFGGVLGIVITITVMLGVKSLGPVMATSVILISQLFVAALIDAFGIMDSHKVAFTWNKYVGIALMVCGVIVFERQFK